MLQLTTKKSAQHSLANEAGFFEMAQNAFVKSLLPWGQSFIAEHVAHGLQGAIALAYPQRQPRRACIGPQTTTPKSGLRRDDAREMASCLSMRSFIDITYLSGHELGPHSLAADPPAWGSRARPNIAEPADNMTPHHHPSHLVSIERVARATRPVTSNKRSDELARQGRPNVEGVKYRRVATG